MKKIMLVGVSIFLLLSTMEVWACHKGGPLGFASKDPIMSTTDYIFGSTFLFASTSGTSGCQNWDFVQVLQQEYIASNWNYLYEEAAKGEGPYLKALATAMGCNEASYPVFLTSIHGYYQPLFTYEDSLGEYERTHIMRDRLTSLIEQAGLSSSCRVKES